MEEVLLKLNPEDGHDLVLWIWLGWGESPSGCNILTWARKRVGGQRGPIPRIANNPFCLRRGMHVCMCGVELGEVGGGWSELDEAVEKGRAGSSC